MWLDYQLTLKRIGILLSLIYPQPDLVFPDDEYIYSCTNSVVSGTECTGLIPTPPETDSEADSYSDLYTIPKPPVNNSKKAKTTETKD